MGFEPERVLAALEREHVEHVVVGGLAATMHGSPLRTADVDVCPRRTPENLERLARALRSLGAKIRTEGAPEGLPFACDARFFAGVALSNLTTDAGDVDVCFEPAGTHGYDDLLANAVRFDLDGVVVAVASLDDVIRSKEAAGRPKDHASLPTLRALAERLRRGDGRK